MFDGVEVTEGLGVLDGVVVTETDGVFEGVLVMEGVGVGVADGHAHKPLVQTPLTISPVLNRCEGGLGDEFTI